MALGEAIQILEIITPIAETLPVVGTPLKGALEALGKILGFAKGAKANKEQAAELAEQAARWLQTLVNALNGAKARHSNAHLEELRSHVDPLIKVLNDISASTQRLAEQSMQKRLIGKFKDEDDLKKLRSRLEDTCKRFMLAAQIRNEGTLVRTEGALVRTESAVVRTEAVVVRTENAVVRTEAALGSLLTSTDRTDLNSLKPVHVARYDSLSSPTGCLENTREDVLREMLTWAADRASSLSIFWLAGLAGTGKSTITKTFCERVSNGTCIVATWFASRNSAERRDPYNIIHTFAYELAVANPLICSHVLSAIRSPPDIMARPMKEQIDRLIAEPIAKAEIGGYTIVLVIDALDECDKIDRVEGGNLIPFLVGSLRDRAVKVLISSRQEDGIGKMFNTLSHIPLRLHEVNKDQVANDVRKILVNGFSVIKRERGVRTAVWPAEKDLSNLVHQTGHLLIFAVTVLKFVDDDRFSPVAQLNQVLTCGATSTARFGSPFSQVDALYIQILQAATFHPDHGAHLRLCERVGNMLRTIVLLEEALSILSLAQLMLVSEDELSTDVQALSAVLLITNDEENHLKRPVRIFHPSFRDFLADPERCSNPQFLVVHEEHHQDLFRQCMEILNRGLRYDICHIQDPSLSNADVEDLSESIKKFVSDALRYAALFWPVHSTACGTLSDALCDALLEFCTQHMLHWLELMSLLGQLAVVGRRLTDLIAWSRSLLNRVPQMEKVSILLNDANRLFRAYATPMGSHALHVYQSALATAPLCKLLQYIPRDAPVIPQLRTPRAAGWNHALQVIEGHRDAVNSVAFSPDGTQIVSGSCDHTLRLWDARAGVQHSVLKGHSGRVNSVAFSPDGTQIVSGSDDMTVRVWDVQRSAQLVVLEGHSNWVRSVAFSLDGTQVVSGSHDETVRVWDVQSSAQLVVLKGHDHWVNSVAFSPDGTQVVSGSDDMTVRVWDVQRSAQLLVLEGHGGWVRSVAFSLDGTQVVSGSHDETVRVWDVQSSVQLLVLEGHGSSVLSVAFSPDGTKVVSGHGGHDKTVRVWDVQSSAQLLVLEGHGGWVSSVAFSPDGTQVVSGSDDQTIRVWDMQSSAQLVVLEGHSDWVYSVAFSPDGTQVASGSHDKTVRVWDVQSSAQLTVLEGHSNSVTTVAFSPDGTQIVSGSCDTTVRIWDVQSSAQLAVLDGHGDSVNSVAFSPDGTQIVSGSDDQTVRVWDVQSSAQLVVLEGHGGWVNSVAFSPDRTQVVSGSYDKTVRVWDVQNSVQLVVLEGHSDPVQHVTFSSDGQRVDSQSGDGQELSWDVRELSIHKQSAYGQSEVVNLTPTIDVEAISWDESDGWISWRPAHNTHFRQLCWVPQERRGYPFASQGHMAVIGGRGGAITILDFSDPISLLKRVATVS